MAAIPFQRSLFRNLVFGPLLLGVSIFVLLYITLQALNSITAGELTGRAIAEMDASLRGYLHPVEEIADVSYSLGRSGRLPVQSPEQIDEIAGALLSSVEQISSIHIASRFGSEYMMLVEPDGGFYNRQSDPADPGFVVERRWRMSPSRQENPAIERTESDYDARERPWFRRALTALEDRPHARSVHDLLVWSDPYRFFTTDEPGITASVAFPTVDGEVLILAFDILLTDIARFAEETQLRSSGVVFVLMRPRSGAELVVLATSDNQDAPLEFDFPMETSELSGAPRDFIERLGDFDDADNREPIRFRSGGEDWWGAIARSPLSSEKEIWIVAALPEDEVLSGIPDIRWIIGALILITVLLMIYRARSLAGKYGAPVSALVAQTERMGRLNFTREESISSSISELQTLANSQETLRTSLAALTAMNERNEIAREMRKIPIQMQSWRHGETDIGIFDRPGDPVGGHIAMLYPTEIDGSGTWRLAGDTEASPSCFIVLVETQLADMEAGERAIALRAWAGAQLDRGVEPAEFINDLLRQVRATTLLGTAVSIVSGFVDAKRGKAKFVYDNRSVILRTGSSDVSLVDVHDGKSDSPGVCEIELASRETLILTTEAIYSVMNEGGANLSQSQLGAWLDDGQRDGASAIGEKIVAYAGSQNRSVDIALAIIRQT